MPNRSADLLAARVTGLGIGLVALMLTWLIGQRVASAIWSAPVGPLVAGAAALIAGAVVTIIAARRLAKSVQDPRSDGPGSVRV